MTSVDVDEARARWPDILARVRTGEEISISERDRVIAKLVPAEAGAPRKPGRLKGRIALTPGFFEPLPEAEQDGWEPG